MAEGIGYGALQEVRTKRKKWKYWKGCWKCWMVSVLGSMKRRAILDAAAYEEEWWWCRR